MKVAFKLDAPSTFSEYERERIKENLGRHAGSTLGRQKLRAKAAPNGDVTNHVLEARANDLDKGRAVGVVAGIDNMSQDHLRFSGLAGPQFSDLVATRLEEQKQANRLPSERSRFRWW